jgi:class 3 adenylate cyclase/TolB-like protein/Flp pilus assembly protein TadD
MIEEHGVMTNPAETNAQNITAVMFTDIAGFSQKLSENEVRAFELLKTHDALVRVLTAKFDGKVIKSLGDSFMVEFPSGVNAVKCAVEIQKRFWNFNRDKSESDTIRVRVGIHSSDTAVRHGDLVGEDSAIASRIEAMTEPNRICISLDVYQHIKNTLPLRVFRIGLMELKDISRQIEVYEILIDSISELAQPSATALQISSSQQTAFAAKREAEELHEAKRIEETKQRILSDQSKSEEERKKKIAAHYTRAEIFFEAGALEKAEQELAEIAKLDPQQRPPTERERQEKENEQIIQNHLLRAREFFSVKELDAAEEQVNEIFRMLPLHVGAQQLLMQIEEERYRQEERKRAKHTETTTKQVSESEKKIEALLEQGQALLQEEKYTEAIFVLHELFLIDPNHSGGRRLEESIRQAEQARTELQRIQAEQTPEEQRFQELAKLRRKVEDQRQRQTQGTQAQATLTQATLTPATQTQVKRTPIIRKELISKVFSKEHLRIAAIVVLVIAALFIIPKIFDWIFPKKASIAVLRFTSVANDGNDMDLLDVLPVLLAEDFARCEHLTVIAPTSALLYSPDPAYLQKIASNLHVEYLLVGSVQKNDEQYHIQLHLLPPDEEKTVDIGTIDGSLSSLSEMRINILQDALRSMGIRSDIPVISQPANTEGLEYYIRGIHSMRQKSGTDMDSARILLQTAIQIDPSLCFVYGALADLQIRTYKSIDDPQFLQSATEYAQRALRCSPKNALAYRVLATSNRFSQNYYSALSSASQSIELFPQDPECYRELALLSLISRRFDEAASFASTALIYDPRNAESHFTLGLVHHMKQDYFAAENSYQQAQTPGENSLMLMAYYVQNVWIGEGNYDKVVRYCKQMILTSPENYRYYYWAGRAYQLSLQINIAQEWLEKGLSKAEQAIDDDPEDAIAHTYAGLIYSRLGKFPEGEAAMNKAMRLDSNSVEVVFRNANLYSIQRNKQKALAAFQKAVHRSYDFAEILNPDLSFIAPDPEFLTAISLKIDGKWPIK